MKWTLGLYRGYLSSIHATSLRSHSLAFPCILLAGHARHFAKCGPVIKPASIPGRIFTRAELAGGKESVWSSKSMRQVLQRPVAVARSCPDSSARVVFTKASQSFRLSPALLICTKGVWGRETTQNCQILPARPHGRRVFRRLARGPRK